ncbi:MAG: hypothetical protein FJ295_01085 [Planctomycetes bacterium]|nr:hypothetical protein [Planctomycetota bacterium]
MRTRPIVCLALLITLTTAGRAPAQHPSHKEEPWQIRQRIESLERQNAELRSGVISRLPATEGDLDRQEFTAMLDEPSDPRIQAAIEKYFKDQEARKQAEEELRKQEGYAVGSELSMSAQWNNGLELSSKNRDFRVHVGGRTQLDVGWFSVDRSVNSNINTPYGDGADFRRARLRVDGTMYELIDWAAEYDFVNSVRVRNQPGSPTNPGFFDEAVTAPTDLWWTFKELPIVGNLRIGNQKEAIGFEHLVSSRFLPFMERSYNQDTFYGGAFNGFAPGISVFNTYGPDELGVWQLGLYKPCNSVFAFNTGDGDYSVVGRVTRLLWYVNEGEGLLHVGVSGKQATGVSQAGVDGRILPFRTRDAIRTGLSVNWSIPASITLFGDDLQQVNSEIAAVYGPWTLQAEYLVSGYQDARTTFAGAPVGTAVYHGGYVQILKFLTADHDHYNKKTGVFERVKPTENFFLVRDDANCRCFGTGAWQVGARYDYLDLNDLGLNGGILHNATLGLNWFLNPNMRMQFNYIATYRDAPAAGDGWIQGWGMRFAHDF